MPASPTFNVANCPFCDIRIGAASIGGDRIKSAAPATRSVTDARCRENAGRSRGLRYHPNWPLGAGFSGPRFIFVGEGSGVRVRWWRGEWISIRTRDNVPEKRAPQRQKIDGRESQLTQAKG